MFEYLLWFVGGMITGIVLFFFWLSFLQLGD